MSSTPATLVIAAHPDDAEFGCGGTVAKLTSSGERVVYCVVSDGAAGGSDRTLARAAVASVREQEQRAAASVLGVKDIHFLHRPDGDVVANRALRVDLARVIRMVRPARVITHAPVRTFQAFRREHPDHLATGEAAMCAVYPDARTEHAVPELLEDGLKTHAVGEMWLMDGPAPDLTVGITTTIDRKIDAILCHRSQLPDPDGLPDRIRRRSRQVATASTGSHGDYAEVFQRYITS